MHGFDKFYAGAKGFTRLEIWTARRAGRTERRSQDREHRPAFQEPDADRRYRVFGSRKELKKAAKDDKPFFVWFNTHLFRGLHSRSVLSAGARLYAAKPFGALPAESPEHAVPLAERRQDAAANRSVRSIKRLRQTCCCRGPSSSVGRPGRPMNKPAMRPHCASLRTTRSMTPKAFFQKKP